MAETENEHLHRVKDEIPKQPLGPYNRDARNGENPEVDDITDGSEANKQRDKMQRQEKAEGDR